MNESRSSNTSFIDSTRSGTLVAADLRSKEQRSREKEAMFDDSDPKPKKAQKDFGENDWWVDAEDDEELMDAMLQKHGFGRAKTDSILLCPACFATLCNICQQHEVHHDQYRALIVTANVRVSKKNPRIWKDESGVCFEYWTAHCRSCDVEVGTYDPLEEMYHFHDVLPSR
jgi:hypothetical protein